MALMKCPECSKEISDKAPACIHCGCPFVDIAPSDSSDKVDEILNLFSPIGTKLEIQDADSVYEGTIEVPVDSYKCENRDYERDESSSACLDHNNVVEANKKRSIFNKTSKITIPIVLILVISIFTVVSGVSKQIKYNEALKFLDEDKYDNAIEAFRGLAHFRDSEILLQKSIYDYSLSLFEQGYYDAALTKMFEIENYEDAPSVIEEIKYFYAIDTYEQGDFVEAKRLFREVPAHLSREYLSNIEIIGKFQGVWEDYSSVLGKTSSYYTVDGNQATWTSSEMEIEHELIPIKEGGISYVISRYVEPEKYKNSRDRYWVIEEIDGKNCLSSYSSYESMVNKETGALNKLVYTRGSSSTHIVQDGLIPYIGMPRDELLVSAWGKPKDINTTTTRYGSKEQWVYPNSKYVYVEENIVIAIQD